MNRILRTPLAGLLLAVFAAALMGLGIYRGEMEVVLEKAVNLCMECVGIG